MFDLTTTNEVQTMTSREIAELTGKMHTHVIADIRKMLAEIGGETKFRSSYISAQNKLK
mgnify:CR=1 FL=1